MQYKYLKTIVRIVYQVKYSKNIDVFNAKHFVRITINAQQNNFYFVLSVIFIFNSASA